MSKNNAEAQNADSFDIYVAKLAVAGAAVVVLGDSLALLAASLALQSLQQSSSDPPTPLPQQPDEQIDYLIRELKQIKKMMRDYKA
ncbi:MAG: translation initiation factor 2 [Solibacillus sp.]